MMADMEPNSSNLGRRGAAIRALCLLVLITVLMVAGCAPATAPADDPNLDPAVEEPIQAPVGEPTVEPAETAGEAPEDAPTEMSSAMPTEMPTATPRPLATKLPATAQPGSQPDSQPDSAKATATAKASSPPAPSRPEPTVQAATNGDAPLPETPPGGAPDGELLADLPAQIGPADRTEIRVQFTVDATNTESVVIEIGNPSVAPEDLTPSLQAARQIITVTLPAAPQMGVSLGLSPGIVRVEGLPLNEIVWRPLVEKSDTPGAESRWRQQPQVWEWIVEGEPISASGANRVSEVRVRVYQRATASVAFADLVTGFDFPILLVRPDQAAGPIGEPESPPTPADPNGGPGQGTGQPGTPLQDGAQDGAQDGPNRLIWGMVIALLLLAGWIVWMEMRRRRTPPPGPEPTHPPVSPPSQPGGSEGGDIPLVPAPSVVPKERPIVGYTTLNLAIMKSGDGYRVLAKSEMDDREAAHSFALDFKPEFVVEVQSAIQLAGLRAAQASRRVGNREETLLQLFGTQIFDKLIDQNVRDLYTATVEKARGKKMGVVLRFNFEEVPELAALPWEYIYDTRSRRFLALDSTRPLVRYQRCAVNLPGDAMTIRPPLRVLVVESRPKNLRPLDTSGERRSILAALQGNPALDGLIELEILEDATLSALQSKLRSNSYHVFHFIGHGTYSQGEDIGYLIFEDKDEEAELVPGHVLGNLLGDHYPVRLVFLNACEGATVSGKKADPFRGVATSLIQRNLPAVIAMQTEITDRAAVQLAADFYAALAANYPVDAALAEARKALDYHFPGSLEWGKPVLYLCQQTGKLFDLGGEGRIAGGEG